MEPKPAPDKAGKSMLTTIGKPAIPAIKHGDSVFDVCVTLFVWTQLWTFCKPDFWLFPKPQRCKAPSLRFFGTRSQDTNHHVWGQCLGPILRIRTLTSQEETHFKLAQGDALEPSG